MVIPKPLREALGLRAGQELEIETREGRIEIDVAPTPMRLERRGRGRVAVPERELPPLTADQVRQALERARR